MYGKVVNPAAEEFLARQREVGGVRVMSRPCKPPASYVSSPLLTAVPGVQGPPPHTHTYMLLKLSTTHGPVRRSGAARTATMP